MRPLRIPVRSISLVILFCSSGVSADPLDQGQPRFAVTAAAGSAFQNDYFVLGGGFGFFVLDGFELGVESEVWIGRDPTISKLGPSATYAFHFIETFPPYVGIFYNHWFISNDMVDADTLGARVGCFYVGSDAFYVGLGLTFERLLGDCGEDCHQFYPELSIRSAF